MGQVGGVSPPTPSPGVFLPFRSPDLGSVEVVSARGVCVGWDCGVGLVPGLFRGR